MSGHTRPLTCCDRDCAGANGCRVGGYQCKRCERWFCSIDLNEDGFCEDCEEHSEESETEEEDD